MLNQEKSQLVQSFCRKEGITLYMFLLSVFGILLHRYSGDDDICIGTAIANRNRPEVEKIIGFFVNNLVMRMNFSDDPTFRDLLAKIRETTLDAYSHQDLPFEMLVDTLQPRRNLSYTPLFQVGFDVQSTNLGSAIFEGVDVTPIQFDSGQSAYDMLLSMTITSEGIIGQFEYNTDLFFDDTIQRLISNIQKLIEESIQDQDIPVSYLPIISDDERMKILREWNFTAQNTDFNHCIHERFEAWVEKQPDLPALFFEGQILSYSALNQKANQLATHLRNIGVGPEKIVGILNERSMETIISILAILKAGGAFLPLDPNYPIERIHYMIQDASHSQIDNSIFIITNEELAQKHQLDHTDKTIILGDTWDFSDGENPKNLPIISKPDNLAYVIYTSGSTGKPKGTQLIHRGLCNLSEVQKNIFEITPDSKILQFSPLSFDASVWETFMALGNGATLYLARQEVLSSGLDLLKFLKQEKISVVTLPPSLLAVLPNEDIPELRTIIAAGEACSKEIVERWGVNRNFFNAYGPTEATVCATIALCNQDDTFSPSIGKPLPNFQVFIVDRNLKPTPIGVPGELLIGGPGVARGYINQSQLTKEKFIFNPFSTSGKLYRTGDLVRYRNDGNVEFLGRIDQQVKVRGFRIELGEIEHALRQAPGVGDAVVIVREDNPGDKRLVGYLVPVNGIDESAIHIQDVKENIRKILPEYMVPGFLMILSSFPLSPSGKVDRKALPHPESQPSDVSIDYVALRTPIAIELCHICEELLSKKEVGIFHNFFELGGHSLLATQFMSRIRDKFTVELPLRVLFEHPTVAELSLEIEKIQHHSTQNDIPTMKPVSRENRRIKRSELESKE